MRTPDSHLDDAEPGKALFLAGLSETCEFTDLHDYFEPFGRVVLCRVLKDAKTGRSRRVGYVNFESHADAVRAMNGLQGKPGPGGAPFDIKIAAQDPTFKPVETKKVFVRYVPVNVTVNEVRDAFAQFGEIDDCVVLRDLSRTARREPGPWNMAYITYKDTKDAITAIAKAQSIIRFGDQDLTVKPAVSEETLRLRSRFRQAGGAPPGLQPRVGGSTVATQPPPMPNGGQYVAVPPGFMPVLVPTNNHAHHHHFAPQQHQQQQVMFVPMMQQQPALPPQPQPLPPMMMNFTNNGDPAPQFFFPAQSFGSSDTHHEAPRGQSTVMNAAPTFNLPPGYVMMQPPAASIPPQPPQQPPQFSAPYFSGWGDAALPPHIS